MQSLIDDKVREEVLYREALALGLDKDDTIVKRQLARKMEFLAEDVSKLEVPQTGELKAWFEKNKDRFALPPRVSFRHIYFSPDRRGTNVRADAERVQSELVGKPMDAPAVAMGGDPFMFQQYYGDRPFDESAPAVRAAVHPRAAGRDARRLGRSNCVRVWLACDLRRVDYPATDSRLRRH